jgi:hypothetical protein
MTKQAQVEGFEREMTVLTRQHEAAREGIIAHAGGEFNDAVMLELRVLCAEFRWQLEVLRIEYGL